MLQHTATRCNTLQRTSSHCNTLQHTATHCNTLQHTATRRSIPVQDSKDKASIIGVLLVCNKHGAGAFTPTDTTVRCLSLLLPLSFALFFCLFALSLSSVHAFSCFLSRARFLSLSLSLSLSFSLSISLAVSLFLSLKRVRALSRSFSLYLSLLLARSL